MRVERLAFVAGMLALALSVQPCAWSAEPEKFQADARPLLKKYCFACHGEKLQEAEVDLSIFPDEASLAKKQEQWLSVMEMLRGYTMPPPKEPQPSPEERQQLLAILSAAMDRIDEARPPRAGQAPLRRLNRVEYRNTLRDLLGLDLALTVDFPADDTAHGFDNVADGLSLSPLLMEKYLTTAEQALDKVVLTEPQVNLLDLQRLGSELRRGNRPALTSESQPDVALLTLDQEAVTIVDIPAMGEYLVRAHGWRTCTTNDPATLVLKVDGVDAKAWTIDDTNEQTIALEARLPLQVGQRRISLLHTWHTASVPKGVKLPEIRVHIASVGVTGPLELVAHRQIFFVEPGNELSEPEAARQVVTRFASLAYRRSTERSEVDRLMALYQASRKAGRTHVEATRAALAAVLVSPHFLYHLERDTSYRDERGAFRLSDWELASRLSYFLWSTMPDEELRGLAAAGKLHDDDVLVGQIERMLADPRADALVENFGGQWLGLRRLESLTLDSKAFPQFRDSLRRAMREESLRFFSTIMREDRDIGEFVSANWTWLNEELAAIYGERDVKGNYFRQVKLSDPNRGGVITMPATLAMTSLPTRTSAVKRGKWILDEVIGAPPPPPPPNVPDLEIPAGERRAATTLRERLQRHRDDPRCLGCHVQMDTLGLGLENFDAIGRWRKQDLGRDIDPAGTLPGGEKFATPAELKQLLSQRKPDFARCLTEKMFVYSLGRKLSPDDRREVKRVVAALERDGRFSTLVTEIVRSYPFRYREASRPADSSP